MANHKILASIPSALLGKLDAFFDVYQDGSKLGTLTISKGAIEWYPKNAKQPYKMGWKKFDRIVKKGHE